MRKRILVSLTVMLCSFLFEKIYAQCDTTNATGCVCAQSGQTNCDLLPDMIVARPPLTASGTSGIIEYSQSGNGTNDGLLRISVSTPNIGFGPLEVHATNVYICGTDTFYGTAPITCPNSGLPPKVLVNQRIYHKNGNVMTHYDLPAGSMTYHPTHGHMHVDDWGIYTLRTQTSDPNPLNWPIIGSGAKLAFCLEDYGTCSYYNGHCVNDNNGILTNDSFPNFGLGGGGYNCSPVMQGISSGYTDIYYQHLDGMWITLPPNLCNGQYWIVVQLDPHNYFKESNENNNVLAVPYTLTLQNGTIPVVTASGPLSFCQGKSVTLTSVSANNYLWSNGATTQSITVGAAGNYTVVINTGSACTAISDPVNVSLVPFTAQATATPSSVCSGSSTTLNSTITAGTMMDSQQSFTKNTQYPIPDNDVAGVASPIVVSGISPGTLTSGSVISVTVNITHTYVGDLTLSLISPSGTLIALSNNNGGGGANYTNTVFSMDAVNTIATGAPPFTGTYLPDGNLNSFTGNINGTWFLKVVDIAQQDTGRIKSWTLKVKKQVPSTYTYNWISNPAGFTSTSSGGTHVPLANTNYSVLVTDANGCTTTASINAQMHALPVATFTGLNSSYTVVDPVATLTGNPTGGTFSGTGVSAKTFNPATAGVGGPYTVTYKYSDAYGCSDNDVQNVSVVASPYNCSKPTQVKATNITSVKAKISWKTATAPNFSIRYKNLTTGSAYQYKTITGPATSGLLTNLTPANNYQVWVKTVCNGLTTSFSNAVTFTTLASKLNSDDESVFDMSPEVYPNPNNGKFTLKFISENEQNTSVEISDLSGRIISKQTLNAVEGNNSFDMDLSTFDNGIYLLRLKQENCFSNLKVIKQ